MSLKEGERERQRMKEKREGERVSTLDTTVENAKRRCQVLIDRIESLSLNLSCKRTLLRLIQSEFSFLSRFSQLSTNHTQNCEPSICFNIGHLEAVVHILQQPNIAGVSRVCKPIPSPPSIHNEHLNTRLKGNHVDIVCTLDGNPVWFIVSDRNPKYISWHGQLDFSRNKGLRARVQLLLDVARCSVALKPISIIFFFSNGLDRFTLEKFQDEFGATELRANFSCFDFNFSEEPGGEWIDILARSYDQATLLEIKVDCHGNVNPLTTNFGSRKSITHSARIGLSVKDTDFNLGGSLETLISKMKLFPLDRHSKSPLENDVSTEADLINFDTTALIAIVSGISNGKTEKLLATPEDKLKNRFKGNYEFVIGQVMSEIHSPIHMELVGIISGKLGIICESVFSVFKELVSMCGGPTEKLRASLLLKHLMVVPDSPSLRMMGLPTTRKLALKNKIVFGTGDYWHAPTLTANMAFVRAVSQTGMSLFTFEHKPRALIGD